MSTFRWVAGLAPIALGLAFGCGSDDGSGDRRGDRLPGTAGLVQRFLEEEVVPNAEGYREAGERLLLAAMGGDPEGVSLSPGPTRFGTLEADLDQDGTRETTLSVSVQLASDDPAATDPVRFTVSQGGPGEPLLSMNGRVQGSPDGTLTVDMAFGSYESDALSIYAEGGSGTRPPEPNPGDVLGTLGFSAFDADYQDIIDGTFTLEAVDVEAYRLVVTVADDPETPEDDSFEFVVE